MKLVSLQDILPPGETTMKGFDASVYVYPDAAKAMWDLGYRIIQRYIRLWDVSVLDSPDGQGGPDSLSRRERDELLDMGYALGLQSFGCTSEKRLPLTVESGLKYGNIAAQNARLLDMPDGLPLHSDLEYSDNSPGRGDRVITYHNAFTDGVRNLNYDSGIYLGGNLGVSAHDLYWKMKTKRYWLSAVWGQPEPEVRGVQIKQTAPKTIKVGKKTFEFDQDTFSADKLGAYPLFVVAG